jgi:glycosyltransferase involved in cell wall biosynthesis
LQEKTEKKLDHGFNRTPMKIAVVTPTFRTERSWLEQCLDSVRRQTAPCTHFLVNDGDQELAAWFKKESGTFAGTARRVLRIKVPDPFLPGVEYLELPRPHEDNGNAARAIGSISAISRGFEAIAYLDADNWFEPHHLERLLDLHLRTGAAVCTAGRNLVDLEGQFLGRCPEVDGEKFADTSSLFWTRAAFGIVAVWYQMPRALAPACDRIVWKAVKDQKLTRAHHGTPTVNFRTQYAAHYRHFGRQPPPGAKHVEVQMTSAGEYVGAEVSSLALSPSPHPSPPSTGERGPEKRSDDPLSSRGQTAFPAVSLCMIVKNEEARLGECLAPIASLFRDIIVVDTGSTDNTREVARRHGAKVVEFAWQDSFSAARNEWHRNATGKWIFWLDADERLDGNNLEKLSRLFATLPGENNAYLMCQNSTPDPATGANLVVDQARLYRNLPDTRWRYRVHEQILLALREHGANEVRTDIVIDHRGYEDANTRQAKRERNLRLLQLDLEENPHDGFLLYNLASCHLDAGQAEKAIAYLQQCLKHAPGGVSYLPKAYAMLSGAHQLVGRADESLYVCRQGKELFPQSVGLWFQEGMLLLGGNDLAGARQCFETILELPAQANYVGGEAGLAACRTRHNLGYLYRHLGLKNQAEEQWLRAIEERPPFEPPWLGLVELYLADQRRGEAERLLGRLHGQSYADKILPALQARLLLADRKVTEARKVLEDALARNPHALWLRGLLAEILLSVTDDFEAAETHLRAILALCPNEQQARQNLAHLLDSRQRHPHPAPLPLSTAGEGKKSVAPRES